MSYDHWKTTNPADEQLGPEAEGEMKTQYEWTPKLRTKAIAEDGREFANLINAAIDWDEKEFDRILETGKLNGRQCKALWEWLGRTDKVPKQLKVYINREDMERCFPPQAKIGG